MKTILISIMALFIVGCANGPRVYTDGEKICSWDSVDELIICKE